jgi:ribulose-5-phosphate 4-epimerase/fuculose-1-phosphate aldolase
MERYTGVKFQYHKKKSTFEYDERLEQLNSWASLFSELGLAPIHSGGAYGNFSYRTSATSFIITKSGMIPSQELQPSNFCSVYDFNQSTSSFSTYGQYPPSSESFLHNMLYSSKPAINAIFHGHSSLLNLYAEELMIPSTEVFYDYGTVELAESAFKVAATGNDFFILKDHGFIALGENMSNAGKLTLQHYAKLITLLEAVVPQT